MFTQIMDRNNKVKAGPSRQTRLHSIHALLRGHGFEGQFEAARKTYRFNFAPNEASVIEQKLVLVGRLVVRSPQLGFRFVEAVKATLLGTQGGVGVSPVRRQLLTGTAQTAQTATSEQKMEQERGPETDLQPGLHAFEKPKLDELGRPNVESTGPFAFVGVLYFQLSPIDAQALGVPLDLSRVQLNARLQTIENAPRDLQILFSDLVELLASGPVTEAATQEILQALNIIFKS
jgi:hypothetical protein